MTRPKLILLYGFAAIGKTTVAKRYAGEHALAMNLDQDKIISMLGLWPEHEAEARKLVSELCKTLAVTYLRRDHDVVVPCLPTMSERVQDFERIAKDADADFFEVALTTTREDAIQRLLARGKWGEEGSLAVITKADLPAIEKLYDDVSKALTARPKTKHIQSVKDQPEATYQQFLAAIA